MSGDKVERASSDTEILPEKEVPMMSAKASTRWESEVAEEASRRFIAVQFLRIAKTGEYLTGGACHKQITYFRPSSRSLMGRDLPSFRQKLVCRNVWKAERTPRGDCPSRSNAPDISHMEINAKNWVAQIFKEFALMIHKESNIRSALQMLAPVSITSDIAYVAGRRSMREIHPANTMSVE